MLANKQEISCNGTAVSSPRRIASTVNIHNRADAFATTHWSLVLAAQGQSVAAEEALEELCRIYWRPLYAFACRQGCDPEEARDLTQGFFELLLKRRDLDAARREKGRLRSYLLVSFKHFLGGERRREMTIKRGYGQWLIPLEELHATERAGVPASGLDDYAKVHAHAKARTDAESEDGELGVNTTVSRPRPSPPPRP